MDNTKFFEKEKNILYIFSQKINYINIIITIFMTDSKKKRDGCN